MWIAKDVRSRYAELTEVTTIPRNKEHKFIVA